MEQPDAVLHSRGQQDDSVERVLLRIAHLFLIGSLGLLPLIFFPIAYAPLEYTKTFVVLISTILALLFYSLSILRSGRIEARLSPPLLSFGVATGIAIVAALVSADRYDAFISDTLGVETALFSVVLFLVMLASYHLLQTKALVMRLYILLMVSALGLGLVFLLRLLFGGAVLRFGILVDRTDNILGSFNDLALFFCVVVLLSLVALAQLALTKSGQVFFTVVITISLLILAVVNFFTVWLVLGMASMILLVYSLARDHFSTRILGQGNGVREQGTTSVPILASTIVFIAALIFIIGGSAVGGFVGRISGISYVEVRPSLQATVDIARAVYTTDAVFGVGPNRFADAWRLHKDQSLNQTSFWATDFMHGSGFITTKFVTMGVLGGLAWVVFIALFFWSGVRVLFQAAPGDRMWYFITTASFIGASFLWFMSCIYTPGAAILIIAAALTGVTLSGVSQLRRTTTYRISVEQGRQVGLLLVGSVMIVMVVAVAAMYYIGRNFTAEFMFLGAVSGSDGSPDLETVERTIVNAYALVPSDTYARQLALYQVAKMNVLLNTQEPSAAEQQEFNKAAVNGINAAKQAIAADPTNPVNYTTHATLLSIMAAAGVVEAIEPAHESFGIAKTLDPVNPSYLLLEAQLDARANDTTAARSRLEEAMRMKPNYADALYLLSQLDIAEGRVDDAIARTRSIVTIDPNNPARYYQLGILLSSNKQRDEAIATFEQAVALDANYANARYFLALGYLDAGRIEDAIAQLEVVAQLNPNNAFVSNLIDDIRSGKEVPSTAVQEAPIETEEEAVVTNTDGSITTTEAPDTDLITTVNPVTE